MKMNMIDKMILEKNVGMVGSAVKPIISLAAILATIPINKER